MPARDLLAVGDFAGDARLRTGDPGASLPCGAQTLREADLELGEFLTSNGAPAQATIENRVSAHADRRALQSATCLLDAGSCGEYGRAALAGTSERLFKCEAVSFLSDAHSPGLRN